MKGKSVWSTILKVVIAVATAIAGVVGISSCIGGMRVINLIVVHCSATKADRGLYRTGFGGVPPQAWNERTRISFLYPQERGYKNNPSHRENRGACAWT